MVKKIRKTRLLLEPVVVVKRAQAGDLWVTKEGFYVQIRAMSDMHLLNVYLYILNATRNRMIGRDDGLYVAATESNYASLPSGSAIEAVVKELRYRRLIDQVPESF